MSCTNDNEPITVYLERRGEAKYFIFVAPSLVKKTIATEANKTMPSKIFHALKGSDRVEGSENLEAAGGVRANCMQYFD